MHCFAPCGSTHGEVRICCSVAKRSIEKSHTKSCPTSNEKSSSWFEHLYARQRYPQVKSSAVQTRPVQSSPGVQFVQCPVSPVRSGPVRSSPGTMRFVHSPVQSGQVKSSQVCHYVVSAPTTQRHPSSHSPPHHCFVGLGRATDRSRVRAGARHVHIHVREEVHLKRSEALPPALLILHQP